MDDPGRGRVGVIAQCLADASAKTVRVVDLAVSGAKARDVLGGPILRMPEVTEEFGASSDGEPVRDDPQCR